MSTAVATGARGGKPVHWPALDGLRGLAVAAVLVYHAFPDISPNGFAGVDVFFVLSGFLITSLLLREFEGAGRVSLRHFYIRRLLRLYPALTLAVALVCGLAIIDGDLRSALPGATSALTYMSHVTIALGINSGLLAHTWTLSLEEHYYVFWPAVLMCILRGGWWRLVGVMALIALAVLFVPGAIPSTMAGMYWRALSMIVGSVMGLVLHHRPTMVRNAPWGPLGLVCLAVLSAVLLTPLDLPSRLAQGPLGLPTVLSVVVILVIVGAPTSSAAWLLSLAPMLWLGKRAYGVYLYHFPIVLSPLIPGLLARLGIEAPLVVDLLLAIGLTLVITWASYRWLEQPFLRLKDRFRGKRLAASGVPATAAR